MTNENPEVLIDEFKGDYHFLSNFYFAPVKFLGQDFTNNEAAFQYAKVDPTHKDAREMYARLLKSSGPKEAKVLGRTVAMRPDWDAIKFDCMSRLVWNKFYSNSDLREKLLATGDAHIQEGTWWNDLTWGVDLRYTRNPMNRPGFNWLGKIHMATRDMLR